MRVFSDEHVCARVFFFLLSVDDVLLCIMHVAKVCLYVCVQLKTHVSAWRFFDKHFVEHTAHRRSVRVRGRCVLPRRMIIMVCLRRVIWQAEMDLHLYNHQVCLQ